MQNYMELIFSRWNDLKIGREIEFFFTQFPNAGVGGKRPSFMYEIKKILKIRKSTHVSQTHNCLLLFPQSLFDVLYIRNQLFFLLFPGPRWKPFPGLCATQVDHCLSRKGRLCSISAIHHSSFMMKATWSSRDPLEIVFRVNNYDPGFRIQATYIW